MHGAILTEAIGAQIRPPRTVHKNVEGRHTQVPTRRPISQRRLAIDVQRFYEFTTLLLKARPNIPLVIQNGVGASVAHPPQTLMNKMLVVHHIFVPTTGYVTNRVALLIGVR